ncbi:hypothetical protein F2Q68_00025423 [Brassica cretica]|uniref:C2 domain-containing protein n=1 Tax=Brassica cretica TaxID=69181 RepID=A0A8S9IJI0_BRACR|nr:hypothetical protein F2Q68_00025423 [Brassica cretica]
MLSKVLEKDCGGRYIVRDNAVLSPNSVFIMLYMRRFLVLVQTSLLFFTVRSKHELQEFLKPSLRITSVKAPSTKSSSSYLSSSLSKKFIDSFRINSSSQKPQLEGMVEFIGLLKVTLKKGANLAIRDMMTSDPYVKLTLGQQTVQSTVKKSNLNPVWNEELMLSVPHDYGSVKLQAFDYDTLSADDIMGEAET